MIDLAQSRGDSALREKLSSLGNLPAPPDEAARFTWIATVQQEMFKYGHAYHNCFGDDDLGSRIETLIAMSPAVDDEYFAMIAGDSDQLRRVQAMTASLAGWAAERDIGLRIDVPYVIFQGAFDWQTPTDLARIWFDKVDAPWKKWIEMPRSAHYVVPEEPGRMIVELHNSVLPATSGQVPRGAIVRT